MNNRKPLVQLTQEYLDEVKVKLKRLEDYRQEILVRLQDAREKGDLSENGAYKAARFELSDTDRELRRLRYLVQYGQVSVNNNRSHVDFGSRVTLKTADKTVDFMLVSKHEANPAKMKISVDSPLGRALIGKKEGDEVTLESTAKKIKYKIVKIS